MSKINELSGKQDRELVELMIGDSHAALGELYIRYSKQLTYFCKQYMKKEVDTEDIVHDIFLQLWEKRHFLNPELSFSGYLQTIAQNKVFYKFRQSEIHSRFVRNILTNGKDTINETEDVIIDNDYVALLDEIIENLSQKQKEVFRLSRIEGHTYKEIAKLLHISDDTVKKYASIALKKIKKQITQHTDIHFKTIITLLMFFL